VQRYQPLFLPLAFQIGGFLLLALGLAPGKPEPDQSLERPTQEATPSHVSSEAQAYAWLYGQILQAPKRQLNRSGNACAAQIGVAPATFASWAKRWEAEGRVGKQRSGNSTVWSLPKLRSVKAA
jgi:hypothetical protein